MSGDHPILVQVDGNRVQIRFDELPDLLFSLGQVSNILSLRNEDRVQTRLYPDIQPGNAEENEAWHEHMGPDLRHLFEAAEETMRSDLENLTEGKLEFPVDHLPAWMSALNQARLTLGSVHGIEESDLARQDLSIRDPRDVAILHVHLLGALLHELVEASE